MLADRMEAKQPERRGDARLNRRPVGRLAPGTAAERRASHSEECEAPLIDDALAQRITRLASLAVMLHIGEATSRRRLDAAVTPGAKENAR